MELVELGEVIRKGDRMEYKTDFIGNHVLKPKSWNPVKDLAGAQISYIDLSSVDKEQKVLLSEYIQLLPAEKAPSRAKQIVYKNDILVSTVRPNLNGVAFVDKDYHNATASTGYCVLRPNKTLDYKYLFYWVRSKSFIDDMIKKSTGASYPAVSDTIIKKSKIPLPNVETQKRIAAILDEADNLRQLNKQLIAKYDALTQSLFLDMFGDPVTNPKGWEKKQLGQVLEITSSKRIFKDEYVNNGIPFYRTKEIVELSKGNKISLELFISNKRYEEIKSKFEIPQVGDILLSAVGTIGVMWTVNSELPFYFKDGNLVWLKSSRVNEINPTYLRMSLEYLIAFEKDKLAEGGSYSALTIAKLREFNVQLAPLNVQTQFAERVKLIEQQKQQAQDALQKSEALFNSLLQKAFKGAL